MGAWCSERTKSEARECRRRAQNAEHDGESAEGPLALQDESDDEDGLAGSHHQYDDDSDDDYDGPRFEYDEDGVVLGIAPRMPCTSRIAGERRTKQGAQCLRG